MDDTTRQEEFAPEKTAAAELAGIAEATVPEPDANNEPPRARPRKRGRRRRVRALEVAMLAASLALVVLLAMLLAAVVSLSGGLRSLFSTSGVRQSPPSGSYSILTVDGTIQTGGSGYQHDATVQYVNKMAEDEGNLGLLLYLNTSGGGVYESDELYRALQRYKEETGRPVWAYMGRTCASGGYYLAAAADTIYANPGTTTGSIGVYYQLTDTSGLYEMFGVETVLIRSGENKGVGIEGTEITGENRAVYQALVDESYDTFIEIVAASRGYTTEEAIALGDGRPYTAKQALENGLVDELAEWEDVKTLFEEECGGEGYNTNFTSTSNWGKLISSITGELPKSEAEALLDAAENEPSGLLAMAEGLA